MTDSPIAPPVDVVPVLPAGVVSFGMQLPVQSQSTIYVEPWEPAAGPAELARVALACEAAGFFYVGVCDHTFIPDRLAGAMSTTWYDTIATLGWLAGVTSQIRLLSHIYVAALRHPLRAAKEFATVDVLSSGRVICGVGAGHVTEEFDLMGPAFDERGPATDEAVAGLALGLARSSPSCPGRAGRHRVSGCVHGRCSRPGPRSGSAGRRPPRCGARPGSPTGGCPSRSGPTSSSWPTLRQLRAEYRAGAPLDIGAIAVPALPGHPGGRQRAAPGDGAGLARTAGRVPAAVR